MSLDSLEETIEYSLQSDLKYLNDIKIDLNNHMNLLKAFKLKPDYDKWKDQVDFLIEYIKEIYDNYYIPLTEIIEKLKNAKDHFKEPIDFRRILILGKTRAGKSNFGNVMIDNVTYKTSDSHQSCTKEYKREKIETDENTYEFVDTQGLDDTDDPTIVIDKLKDMIEEVGWQYHFIIYLEKYDTISIENLSETNKFLTDTFGIQAPKKTLKIYTFCPTSKRYKTIKECQKIILNDFSNNNEMSKKLQSFYGVKYVDLPEPHEEMRKNEQEIIIEGRQEERKIILDELDQIKMEFIDTNSLRTYILQMVHDSKGRLDDLMEYVREINKKCDIIRSGKDIEYILLKMSAFLLNSKYKKFYNINETMKEKSKKIFKKINIDI